MKLIAENIKTLIPFEIRPDHVSYNIGNFNVRYESLSTFFPLFRKNHKFSGRETI